MNRLIFDLFKPTALAIEKLQAPADLIVPDSGCKLHNPREQQYK